MSSPAGFTYKKRFGQHFLRDTGVLDRIVRWIAPSARDTFLEIGAGDGALSVRLAPRVSRLFAVERDPECIPMLTSALRPFPHATVVEADILETDIGALLGPCSGDGPVRVAGNLPYNIATFIIEKLLALDLAVADMTFMLQLEVARRVTASPGSREYGLLSVHCQHRADVRFAFTVSPACFVPRPRVTSAVVAFRPFERRWEADLEYRFREVLGAAFGYRRKTLLNSLRRHPRMGPVAAELLVKAGIDGARRAEELSVQEYEHLASVSSSLAEPPRLPDR
jgi:16S rRNA (adenine1518-N6/adenine1519-N6)-dimethyltransferase